MINLILKNASHLEDYIDQLKNKYEGPIYVTIKPLSNEEKCRKEYFVKIGNIGESLGYTKSDMHEFVKENILPNITKNTKFIKSEEQLDSTSTTSLNKLGYNKLLLELKEYMEKNLDKLI